jgi:uncharacterized protein involved in type VI secretion and phage assembly
MKYFNPEKFSFVSQALPEDTFGVVNFRGTEGLNQCYSFEINLVSNLRNIDLGRILQNSATFTIHREEGDIPFHGILIRSNNTRPSMITSFIGLSWRPGCGG